MGLTFGTKKRDVVETSSTGNYLRPFRNGESKVRFLEEPDEWILYQEHFTPERKSFPCTGDTSLCPGCTSEVESTQRRSRKYGTWIYDHQFNATQAYKIPVGLANKLTARAERNGGTIINRDYVVMRSGEGLKTEYDVDQDEKYGLDIAQLLGQADGTIQGILTEMFEAVWGDPKAYESKDEYKSGKPAADEVPDALKSKAELAAQEVANADSDEEITEIQLRGMSRSQLVEVWSKLGLKGWNEDWGKTEIIDNILKLATA